MKVFCVCVRCDRIDMIVNGQSGAHGFFKNEYVQAPDRNNAERLAVEQVKAALVEKLASADAVENAVFEIDEVEEGLSESTLFADEGFVFF